MKILKYLFITVGVIIVLMVIVAFFLPRKVHVERSMLIDAPKDIVFTQVNELRNWEQWSPWHKMDPNIKLTYDGPESGNGASYSWLSEEVGNGKLTIASSAPFDSIFTEMDFLENGKGSATYYFTEEEGGTRVTWTMDSDMGMNPISRWFGLFMDEMLGPEYEKGLQNLKEVAEAAPRKPEYGIKKEEMEAFQAITRRDTTTVENLSASLGALFPEMYILLHQQQASPAGSPFVIYHKWSEDTVVIEPGIPVSASVEVPTYMNLKTIPASPVITAEWTGGDDTEMLHYAMDDWARANNTTIIGAPWEVYVTDRSQVKDSAQWVTRIYYPVQ